MLPVVVVVCTWDSATHAFLISTSSAFLQQQLGSGTSVKSSALDICLSRHTSTAQPLPGHAQSLVVAQLGCHLSVFRPVNAWLQKSSKDARMDEDRSLKGKSCI